MAASRLASNKYGYRFGWPPSSSGEMERGRSTAHRSAVAVVVLLAGICGLIVATILLAFVPPWVNWPVGAITALLCGLVMWYNATPFILRQLEARAVSPAEEPRAYNLLEALCTTSGIAKPQLMVYDKDLLGAGTLGRNRKHAVIVLSTKMITLMSLVELEGVLAHELAHIKQGDNGLNAVSAALSTSLSWISPKLGWTMFTRLQRVEREIEADLTGVAITRYPPALCSVLDKVRTTNAELMPLTEAPWKNAWPILWCWTRKSGLELRLAVLREL